MRSILILKDVKFKISNYYIAAMISKVESHRPIPRLDSQGNIQISKFDLFAVVFHFSIFLVLF